MRLQSRREGFAIPMAIMLVGVITAGIVGAFMRVESESRVVNSADTRTDAYALAEAGLQRYISTRINPPAVQNYALTGGTAQVVPTMLRGDDGTNGALYLIRSTGTPTVRGNETVPATHTVGQFAWYQVGKMQVVSSWTSLSGLRKNGASGDIAGADACGVSGEVAGVAVPDGTFSGNDAAISGDPDIDEMGTQQDMADQINIDWNGIVNNDALPFDYTIPPDSWPTAAQWADPDFWPVIYIDGSTALPSDGRGTLIVRNDLTLGGGDVWEGIILVGGAITDNGSGNVAGAVVSGLNIKLGEAVGESSKANGTKDYSFDSCAVSDAASAMSTMVPMKNTWIDNWAGY